MSDITTIKGLVHKINPTQQVSDKFAKKEIIIKTDGEYPQYILIQFTQKNIDKLDYITTGSTVVVSYNIRGKLWTNPQGEEKCFVTIEGWQIKTENQTFSGEKKEDVKHFSQPDFGATATDGDDLPF